MYYCISPIMALLAFVSLTTELPTASASEFPQHIRAGEHRLVLNGWGTRSKAFLNLYTAGLYLTQPSSDAVAIVAAEEPMAIRIEITSRFVSQSKLVASLADGFQRATAGNVAPIQSQIDQFRQCFADPIAKGDTYDIVYLPAHGVIVNKNGEFKGSVAGIEFKRSLFNIWLSSDPTDENLKQAMLSRRSTR